MYAVVLADDLTGACDTALQFATYGLKTVVASGVTQSVCDVFVVNTQTRCMSSGLAVKQTLHSLLPVLPCATYVYKKIDSTLRGYIGVEIDALLKGLGFQAAFVIPAYPENHRITKNGIHYVNQQPVRDLADGATRNPGHSSSLLRILQEQTVHPVAHIANIAGDIRSEVEDLLTRGYRVLSFDSTSRADLQRVFRALVSMPSILWTGSAGLALEFAKLAKGTKVRHPKPQRGPVLFIIGSRHPQNRKQVMRVRPKVEVVRILPAYLCDEGAWNQCLKRAQALLEASYDVVLFLEQSNDMLDDGSIAKGFAAMTSKLCGTIGGLYLTGGDTAFWCLQDLGIRELCVVDGVCEGVAVSYASNVPFPIITKAGGFGGEDVLSQVLSYVYQR